MPLDLFREVAMHLERMLRVETALESDPTRSAPEPDGADPFSTGRADLGFLCAPGYLWLSEGANPARALDPR